MHEDRGTSEDFSGIVNGFVNNNNIYNNNNIIDNNNVTSRREVAGLFQARPDSPGASLPCTSHRSRPHSLAVQPLNYHRLDPEQSSSSSIVAIAQPRVNKKNKKKIILAAPGKHPSMTSQESIGSCSLDVEKSASDRSGYLLAFHLLSSGYD